MVFQTLVLFSGRVFGRDSTPASWLSIAGDDGDERVLSALPQFLYRMRYSLFT